MQVYAITRKEQNIITFPANFKSVLTIRWSFFLHRFFLHDAVLHLSVQSFVKSYLSIARFDSKPVNFLRVCCPDDSSSWFLV